MRKMLCLSVMGLGGLAAIAEQNPPTPPQAPGSPHVEVRPDARRHEMRAFEFRMGGPDESARILPPGAWWKDQELAKRIELTTDQQKRIDESFLQSKIELVHMHASLEEEELLLGPMLDANPIDQGKALMQIGKIADTRAALEKSNAKMLLQIRGVLTQAQWTKLQQERPGGMRQHIFMRTPDGPHSWNVEVPDLQSLRLKMDAMAPLDSDKLQVQVNAAMKNMPQIDLARLQAQIDVAMKSMLIVNVEKLREQLKVLEAMPPLPPIDNPVLP